MLRAACWFVVRCVLFGVCSVWLRVVRFSLIAVRRLRFGIHCVSLVARCVLRVVRLRCALCVAVCGLSCVVWCLLVVACRLLLAVC